MVDTARDRTARKWEKGTGIFQKANPFPPPRTSLQMTPKSPTWSTVSSLYFGSSTSDTPRSASSMSSSTVVTKNVSSESKGKDCAGLPLRTKPLELTRNHRAFVNQFDSTEQRMQGIKPAHERSLFRVEECDNKFKSSILEWKSPLDNVKKNSTSMKLISNIHSSTKSDATASTQAAKPHREPPTTVASVPRVARVATALGQTFHNVDSKPVRGGGKPTTFKDLSFTRDSTLGGPSLKPAQDKNGKPAQDTNGLFGEMKPSAVFVANKPSVEQSAPSDGKASNVKVKHSWPRFAWSRSQQSQGKEFVSDQKLSWHSDLSMPIDGNSVDIDDRTFSGGGGQLFKKNEKSAPDDRHGLTMKVFSKYKVVEKAEQPFEKSGVGGELGLDGHKLLVKVSSLDKTVNKDMQEKKVPKKFSPDMVILDDSGGIIVGRDSLPITRDEVALDFNGDFLLSNDGYVVLMTELKVRDDGALIGPDGLPIISIKHRNVLLKSNALLLDRNGLPVFSKGGMLVRTTDVMHVNGSSIPTCDVTIQGDGSLCCHDGKLILGDDGLPLMKGDILLGENDKPLLTCQGKPIMQHDLKFSHTDTLYRTDGELVRNQFHQPLLRKDVYIASDGRPRLSCDGKVIEMKDLVYNCHGKPIFGVKFREPIKRTDLQFSEQDILVGLGTAIHSRDGTPYRRGDVLMDIDGKPLLSQARHPVVEADVTFFDGLVVVMPGPVHVLGHDSKPLKMKELYLDANGCPKITAEGRLVKLEELVRGFNGDILLDSDHNPIFRTSLRFAHDTLITHCGTPILGRNGLLVAKDDLLTGVDGEPAFCSNGQLIMKQSKLMIFQSKYMEWGCAIMTVLAAYGILDSACVWEV